MGVKMALVPKTISPARFLLPLGIGTALSLMGDTTLYVVLPTHTEQAGIALGTVGILLGVNRFIRLALNGLSGVAFDRWGRRWLFILALLVGVLSTAIYALTRGFWALLVGRLVWGLAWSGIWVGGTTIILDVSSARERGRWVGLYQTWFMFGASFGALAGGVLTDWLGYGMTMWAATGVSALGLIISIVLLPETGTSSSKPDLVEVSSPQSRLWYTHPTLWMATFVHGLNRLAFAGVLAATVALLVESHLEGREVIIGTATLTGLLIAARSVFSMIAAPLAGTLSDRTGNRWLAVLVGLALAVASMFLVGLASLAAALIGVILGAFATGFLQTPVAAITGDLAGERRRGRAIGFLQTGGDLGSALGPPIAYALLPLVGLAGVYRALAVFFLFNLIGVGWLLRSGMVSALSARRG
ncbi:MAG TPA: MFS transporter [Anaerolineales bacterium]|nr:MFS transporter [Anaerolineales bacterium]